MDLLVAEKAIRDRLDSQINSDSATDFQAPKILTFPQEPVSHFESIHPNGEILVRFEQVLPTEPEPNRSGDIVQEIAIEWSVWIVSRHLVNPSGENLTSEKGAYEYIRKVKDALSGWTLSLTEGNTTTTWSDSTPFYLTGGELIEEQNGIWFYALTFQHILEEK